MSKPVSTKLPQTLLTPFCAGVFLGLAAAWALSQPDAAAPQVLAGLPGAPWAGGGAVGSLPESPEVKCLPGFLEHHGLVEALSAACQSLRELH